MEDVIEKTQSASSRKADANQNEKRKTYFLQKQHDFNFLTQGNYIISYILYIGS